MVYGIVPAWYRSREIPEQSQRIKGGIKLILIVAFAGMGGVTTGGMVVAGLVYDIADSGDYCDSTGFGDWFRMPLQYPYELVTTSIDYDADIRVWEEKRSIIIGILRYHKREAIIVGEYHDRSLPLRPLDTPPDILWFTFDCGNGELHKYESKEDYLLGIAGLGFSSEPQLGTIRQNWRKYKCDPQEQNK